MDTIKVAIVDDNKELVKTMESYFEKHPEIEIIWTGHNGKVCLTMLEEKEPDVLLLDIIMPHLDGIAVLETIGGSSKYNDLHIIMLTAFGQEDVMTQAADLGASYFMLKPFEFDRLDKSDISSCRHKKVFYSNIPTRRRPSTGNCKSKSTGYNHHWNY